MQGRVDVPEEEQDLAGWPDVALARHAEASAVHELFVFGVLIRPLDRRSQHVVDQR